MSAHKKTTVAIIGAGIAGLSTGCYLQMNGYAAHIYEAHTKPGGLCTSWERKGYRVDCCVHWLTGSRPGASLFSLWQEIGLIQGLDLFYHEEFGRSEFPDGTTVIMYTDADRLEKHLLELAPEDAKVIKRALKAVRVLATHELPSDPPPRELMRFGQMLRLMPAMTRLLPLLRRWNSINTAEFAARFKNPYLRQAFSEVWFPEMSAFVLLMTLAWFHGQQAGYPLGGSLPLARTVEKRFLDLGGAVDYKAAVSEVLVENDRAVGVRLADGREERYDVVVSAADLHATVFDMLHGRYGADLVKAWFKDFVPFPPLVFVGVGVNREFTDEPQLASGFSLAVREPFQIGDQIISRLPCHIYNYEPGFAPKGKTMITSMIPVDYDYWKALSGDRSAYEAQKKAIGDQVVKAFDHRFPGLARQVEMVDVSTPTTFERYTNNWRGSFEGWMPTPATLTLQLPSSLPGLASFYLVGQWLAPGGGLPSGVMTARQVTQLLCHRDGREFRTSPQ